MIFVGEIASVAGLLNEAKAEHRGDDEDHGQQHSANQIKGAFPRRTASAQRAIKGSLPATANIESEDASAFVSGAGKSTPSFFGDGATGLASGMLCSGIAGAD